MPETENDPPQVAAPRPRAKWRTSLPAASSQGYGPSGKDSKPPDAKKGRKGDKDGDKEMKDSESQGEAAPAAKSKGGGKGGSHRGGRRHRRGGHTDKKWTSKDTNIQQCLATIAKLTLQTAQRQRLTMATVVDTFTMPKDLTVIVQLQKTLDEYRKTVQAAREEGADQLRAVGSPTASLAVSLVETLQNCDVGGRLKKELGEYLDKIEPQSGGEPVVDRINLELDVLAIKIEQPYDESKAKLLLAAPHWPLRGAITIAFQTEGIATRMTGVMPADWLEDELASWLDVLQRS